MHAPDDQDDPTEGEAQWRRGPPFTVLDRIYLTTWAGIIDGGRWLARSLFLDGSEEYWLYPPLQCEPWIDGCVEKTAAELCPDDPAAATETAFRITFQDPLFITPTAAGIKLVAALGLEDWWPDHPIVGCLDARAVGVHWGTFPTMETLLGHFRKLTPSEKEAVNADVETALSVANAVIEAAAERRRERDEEAMAELRAFLEDHRAEAVTRPVEGAEGVALLPHGEMAGRVSGSL